MATRYLAGLPFHAVNYDYTQPVATSMQRVRSDIVANLVVCARA